MTTKTVLRLAAVLSRQMEAGYAQYLESCEHDRRQGYRPHYCEHGTSNWTDYDNICGPCEDGWTVRDGVTRRREALSQAKARVKAADEIMDAVSILGRHHVDAVQLAMPRLIDLMKVA